VNQPWIGVALLVVIGVLILWGFIRIVAGYRALRRSEKAFLEDVATYKVKQRDQDSA